MSKGFHPNQNSREQEIQLASPNSRATQSNSLIQQQLQDANASDARKITQIASEYRIADNSILSADVAAFRGTNLYKAMVRLVQKEGWDPAYAAAWLGQAVVETGNQTLANLDVVERGNNSAGRGMFQYSHERRRPYDRARQRALSQGKDPNDINWQIDYALNVDQSYVDLDAFREGLTDPNKNYSFNRHWGNATGKTPNGRSYGNRFSNANQLMDAYGDDKVAGYTRALTGEYTRPGIHHLDRREKAAKHILKMYNKANDAMRRIT